MQAFRFHLGYERFKVICLNPQVVDAARPYDPRWLIIQVDEAATDGEPNVARTSDLKIEDNASAKHVAPPPDGFVHVGSEKVGVI